MIRKIHRIKGIIFVLGLLYSASISAQVDADFSKSLSKAKATLQLNDCRGALEIMDELYQKDSSNVELNYYMGLCFFELHEYEKAEKHFNQSATSVSLELFRYKAAAAHANGKLKKAINFYNGYKIIAGKKDLTNDEVTRFLNQISYAELALRSSKNITVENVGGKINTKFDEYNAYINADASSMVFTSDRENYVHNIYQILEMNNGSLVEKNSLNSDKNEIVTGLSSDGNTLLFQKTNKFFIAGNLFMTTYDIENWATPTELTKEINSSFDETGASITDDFKTIYFVSSRPGGYGGKDIYKANRLPDGTWGKAQNLGPIINTPYDEDAPFIASDGKTLYFSSNGHQTMGGFDLFKATATGENWSNPENLGTPINTVRDEFSISLSANGKIAYLSSNRENGFGGTDIYKAIINDPPTNLTVFKGIGFDKKANSTVVVKATLIDEENNKILGIYKAKASTGEFVMIVEPQKTYSILVEADGYHPLKKEMNFDISKNQKPITFLLDSK